MPRRKVRITIETERVTVIRHPLQTPTDPKTAADDEVGFSSSVVPPKRIITPSPNEVAQYRKRNPKADQED